MKQKHILFDLDGTLVKSDPGITKGVKKSLEYFGIHEETENLKKFVGPPMVESYTGFYNLSLDEYEIALKIFRDYYISTGIFESELYEGVEDMLKTLSEQNKLYVATSKPETEAKRVLSHFGVDRYFTFIGGADGDFNTERSTKTGVIEYVLKTNSIEDRAFAIMVGDKSHDIVGAKNTGLRSIGVLYGYGSVEELLEADYIVKNVENLRDMFLC